MKLPCYGRGNLSPTWSIANAKTLQEKVDELQVQLEKLKVESIRGEFRARTDWVDKGNADPFSAVETMLWAYGQGDQDRLNEVTTPRGFKRSDLFPTEHLPVQSIGAVNLIYTVQNQEGNRATVTAFVREDFIAPPGGTPYNINKLLGWRLERSKAGWQVDKKLFFSFEEPGM